MTNLHIGTYAKDGGLGLVPITLAPDGAITAGEPYESASNASFAAYSPRYGLHYFVDEQERGAVGVYNRAGQGWERLARIATNGAAPCYAALDADATRLAVANYESGSVALFPLDAQGVPQKPALFQNRGSGPTPERQDGPHVHCTCFAPDGSLYVVDLGTDDILRFVHGLEQQCRAYRAPAGTGPRHLSFVPGRPLAVLLSELASTLTLLEVTGEGTFRPWQILSTLPEGFKGENLGGHLALNAAGTRVYVSNRGHNSLAVFGLEGRSMELIGHVASMGEHPRHFALLEDAGQLVVAHEKDGHVAAFRIAADGRLTHAGDGLALPGACCVIA